MSPDQVNASFELLGTVFAGLNVRAVYQSKGYAGVSLWSTLFFLVWGGWTLFYYPHLGQWASFAAASVRFCMNAT